MAGGNSTKSRKARKHFAKKRCIQLFSSDFRLVSAFKGLVNKWQALPRHRRAHDFLGALRWLHDHRNRVAGRAIASKNIYRSSYPVPCKCCTRQLVRLRSYHTSSLRHNRKKKKNAWKTSTIVPIHRQNESQLQLRISSHPNSKLNACTRTRRFSSGPRPDKLS